MPRKRTVSVEYLASHRMWDELVEHLAQPGVVLSPTEAFQVMRTAILEEQNACMPAILPHVTCSTVLSQTLEHAADTGTEPLVQQLVHLASSNESLSLILAAQKGHMRIVELLLPHSNPHDRDSLALARAVAAGHVDVVRLLLPVSTLTETVSEHLATAALQGNSNMVALFTGMPIIRESIAIVMERVEAAKGYHKPVIEASLDILANHLPSHDQAWLDAFLRAKGWPAPAFTRSLLEQQVLSDALDPLHAAARPRLRV